MKTLLKHLKVIFTYSNYRLFRYGYLLSEEESELFYRLVYLIRVDDITSLRMHNRNIINRANVN